MKTYKTELPEITLKYKTNTGLIKSKIKTSQDCEKLLRQMFDADTIEYSECMILILLNRANNTIGWIKISSGGITGTVCDPRMIFATALTAGATGIVLSHNHPSGNLQPSQHDIMITKRIVEIGKLHEIELIDHLILTDESYYSFRDEGQI